MSLDSRISKTQLASTPELKGDDAKRLIDSLKFKVTARSKLNVKMLSEYFQKIEKKV